MEESEAHGTLKAGTPQGIKTQKNFLPNKTVYVEDFREKGLSRESPQFKTSFD